MIVWDRFYKKVHQTQKALHTNTIIYAWAKTQCYKDALISDISTNEMYRVVSIVELCVD